MSLTLLISLILILFKYPSVITHILLRTDYYESLSNPVICMQVSHNNPTGPHYLYSNFAYDRYSIIPHNIVYSKSVEYSFKRVGKQCENSVIFTTMGDDFKKIDIKIAIYFSKKRAHLAVFDYTFHKGYIPGIYRLTDMNTIFKTRVKVINGSDNYLFNTVISETVSESYLQSATKNNQICLVTTNNYEVVLTPNYDSEKPTGFIDGLQAIILQDGGYFGKIYYPAYACDKYKSYPDIPTIFIIDKENFSVKFKVIYRQDFASYKEYYMGFKLTNPKFDYVFNLEQISKKYNKVFLMRVKMDFKKCEDGSNGFLHYSEYGTLYFVDVRKKIQILPNVETFTRIYRSLDDPCAELKAVND